MVASRFAALRTLTLPVGATSGPRIVLDGINGRIEIYSNTGDLLMTLDDDGLIVYDSDGDQRQKLGSITDFSSIVFRDSNGENPAIITYQVIPGDDSHRTFALYAPDIGGVGASFSRFFLLTPNNLTKEPLLQWDTGFLDDAGAQPVADFTGFTDDALKVRTVVHDLWYGESNGGGNTPDMNLNASRGCVGYVRTAGPTVLSTTAGTDSFVCPLNDVPVIAGRRYRVMASLGHSLLIGGSGFAAADAWDFEAQMDEGSGFGAITPDKPYARNRANFAPPGAQRYNMPTLVGTYEPANTQTVDFRLRMVKVSGAATVTTTVDTNGGAAPHILTVDDIGLAV